MVNYAARRPSTNLVNGVDVLYLLELRRYYANCPAVLALLPPVPPLEVEEVDYSKRDHPTASRSIVVPENFHANRPRFDVLLDKNLIAPDCANVAARKFLQHIHTNGGPLGAGLLAAVLCTRLASPFLIAGLHKYFAKHRRVSSSVS